jgi:hypothetical protein
MAADASATADGSCPALDAASTFAALRCRSTRPPYSKNGSVATAGCRKRHREPKVHVSHARHSCGLARLLFLVTAPHGGAEVEDDAAEEADVETADAGVNGAAEAESEEKELDEALAAAAAAFIALAAASADIGAAVGAVAEGVGDAFALRAEFSFAAIFAASSAFACSKADRGAAGVVAGGTVVVSGGGECEGAGEGVRAAAALPLAFSSAATRCCRARNRIAFDAPASDMTQT